MEEVTIHVLHDVSELRLQPGVRVVVSGHSHKPRCERVGGVLFFNPGSAGPRRFKLPIAIGFLDVAGAFHLPCVFLADNPGVMAGTQAERAGALRAVARMFVSQHRLRVPKLHVTVRKAFGFGSSIMAMNPFDNQTISLSFPAITLGALPASSGAASHKLSDDEGEFLLDAFRRHHIGTFLLIGGNDSADTVHRLAKLAFYRDQELQAIA